MYLTARNAAEQPDQQIEEMNSNVGGDAAGFVRVAFPGVSVPRSA
jgi:hypothetical protein